LFTAAPFPGARSSARLVQPAWPRLPSRLSPELSHDLVQFRIFRRSRLPIFLPPPAIEPLWIRLIIETARGVFPAKWVVPYWVVQFAGPVLGAAIAVAIIQVVRGLPDK
jgi:hypothetical protein